MNYFRCPYCSADFMGQHGKKINRNIGLFRVKELNNVLVLQCQKCLKVFRITFFGTPLLWNDMTQIEKDVFKKKTWVRYNAKTAMLEIRQEE